MVGLLEANGIMENKTVIIRCHSVLSLSNSGNVESAMDDRINSGHAWGHLVL